MENNAENRIKLADTVVEVTAVDTLKILAKMFLIDFYKTRPVVFIGDCKEYSKELEEVGRKDND